MILFSFIPLGLVDWQGILVRCVDDTTCQRVAVLGVGRLFVVSKLVCHVSVVILVNHATDSRRNIFRNDGVLFWLEFQRFDSVSWRVSFFRIVDTACPSSLVAIHLANKALRDGECSMALVTGVSLILQPDLSISFAKAGMLSHDGHCHSFDTFANGYVRGEGVGAVVLKSLEEALSLRAKWRFVLLLLRAKWRFALLSLRAKWRFALLLLRAIWRFALLPLRVK
jgi:hypothetical protein